MRKCVVCKNLGKNLRAESKEIIYHLQGTTHIPLCYGHSVDLFKMGQKNFVVKYKTQIDTDPYIHDEPVFSFTDLR